MTRSVATSGISAFLDATVPTNAAKGAPGGQASPEQTSKPITASRFIAAAIVAAGWALSGGTLDLTARCLDETNRVYDVLDESFS